MACTNNDAFFRRVEKYEKGAKKDLKSISTQILDVGKLVGKLKEIKANMGDMLKLVDEFKVSVITDVYVVT